MTEGTLDVLLVEDNPGDARLVEEMLGEARIHLGRIDLGGSPPERSALHHETDLASGLEWLTEQPVDVILLDLGLPDSTGIDTLVRVVEETDCTPVVVLTGQDDRDLGIRTIQHGAHDYLVKDEVTAGLLVHSIQHAMEQARQERERIRHRERLEAFNRLYRISQDVAHAIITESTREELERDVCERLVEPDAYDFAWLGDVDHSNGHFSARTSCGEDRGFDVAAIPFEAEAGVERPEAAAVRTREVQVIQDVTEASGFEHCQEQLESCEYRAMTAIPVAHGTVFYGILAIYDESPTALVDADPANLARLGETIGHAIAAVERKDALVSDTSLQLTFGQGGDPGAFVAASTGGWSIEIDRLVRIDRGILAYGTAVGIAEGELEDLVERSGLVTDLRVLSPEQEEYDVELTTNWGETLVPALADHGGVVTALRIGEGELQFVVEVPPGRDKHQLVDLVQDHFPDATLRAQGTVERDDPAISEFHLAFKNRLTAKQRAVIETAYHAGYFEWPRTSTGAEIADQLGVTQATFSEHFRAAERKLFDAVFGTDDEATVPASPWETADADSETD